MVVDKTDLFVVDDDPTFHFVTKIMFDKSFPEKKVQFFKNGRYAIDYIKTHHADPNKLPDQILLDINMPIMDGWQFLDAFGTIKNDLAKPVIIYVVSSSIDEKDHLRAGEISDVTGFIVKPITERDLEGLFNPILSN